MKFAEFGEFYYPIDMRQRVTGGDRTKPGRFGDSSVFVRKRKIGRPNTKNEIDAIRVRLWYWYVSMRLSLDSAYALEKHFADVVVKKSSTNSTSHEQTGKWKQYRKGLVVPHPILVAEVERRCPGSQFLLEHPVWRIISPDIYTIPDFTALLKQLRPGIVKLLFQNNGTGEQPRLERLPFSEKIITDLTRHGDLDALAACLAIIHESLRSGKMYPYHIAIHGAVVIFLRLSCLLPMWYVADDLFEYLKNNLFHIRSNTSMDIDFETINLYSYQRILTGITNMMEDFGLLKPDPRVHLACRFVSSQIGLNKVYLCLKQHWDSGCYKEVGRDPLILTLKKRMARLIPAIATTDRTWP